MSKSLLIRTLGIAVMVILVGCGGVPSPQPKQLSKVDVKKIQKRLNTKIHLTFIGYEV